MYVWTKFEADRSFRSEVIRGSRNNEIRSRDHGHAHLGVVLWSLRREAPSCMSVLNLKRIALSVQKLLGGSQNFDIGSRDPGHAHLGVVCGSYAGRLRPVCLYQI